MTVWSERLNQIADGTVESKAPAVGTLNLPRLSGWLPGRAWLDWKVDPKVFHGGGGNVRVLQRIRDLPLVS